MNELARIIDSLVVTGDHRQRRTRCMIGVCGAVKAHAQIFAGGGCR
jgi:hypothetical protein